MGAEFVCYVGANTIAARTNGGTDSGDDMFGTAAEGTAHDADRGGRYARRSPPPSGVRDGDNAAAGIGEEDRSAVGKRDQEIEPRHIAHSGIAAKHHFGTVTSGPNRRADHRPCLRLAGMEFGDCVAMRQPSTENGVALHSQIGEDVAAIGRHVVLCVCRAVAEIERREGAIAHPALAICDRVRNAPERGMAEDGNHQGTPPRSMGPATLACLPRCFGLGRYQLLHFAP